MATRNLALKKGDKFTILAQGFNTFIAKTTLQAQSPFVLTPPGAQVTPSVEYWEMTDDETVKIDSVQSITDANPVNYPKLAGQRPAKARRSR
jgi:hypothetical protein